MMNLATKSVFKSASITRKNSSDEFVKVLEQAEAKAGKTVELSKPYEYIKPEKVRDFFEGKLQ